MKKIIIVFMVFLLTVSFSACKKSNENEENTQYNLDIVTTIFAPYDFARQITGGKASLTMLLPPGAESHSYEPTPLDIIKIQNCDIFIYVGGESDEWIKDILESMDTDKIKIITLMDCVETVEEKIVEGMEEEEEENENEQELDEHVWTSPKNAKLIVQKISEILCETDTENAKSYSENTSAYINELDNLDKKFQNIVDSASRHTIIFGDRFPFRYLADLYGLEYYAAFPGCSTETEASAKTIKFLIDKIKDEKIPVVFHLELSNKKITETIKESTGAEVLLLHACHNISKTDFDSGIGYMELMNQNAENLKEALK